MAKRKALTIYLNPEDHLYLSQLAASQRTSMSGALRQLLRSTRLSAKGADDPISKQQRAGGTRFYSSSLDALGTASPSREPVLTHGDRCHGKSLLQRLLSDLEKDRHPVDAVSLGDLLDQSREQWITANRIEPNLLEALMADRSSESP